MADRQKEEAIVDEVSHKTNRSDSSPDEESSVKDKVYRLFGREIPVHRVLGGAKLAEVFLWENKKVSAAVLGGATAIWVLFDVLEYHLLALVSHVLIFGLAVLFLWSNAKTFIDKSPPSIPEVIIPEDIVLNSAAALRIEINHGFAVLHDIAAGRDAKKFLSVISSLWALSTIGTWCNFLTLLYAIIVLLFTVPLFYEKYRDKLDSFAKDVMSELKKQYAVFNGRVLTKVSDRPLKGKNE